MTKIGGHFLASTPMNNLAGHRFYQFSPELFFRIFCPANGFETEDLFMFEKMKNPFRARWWEVTDPATLQRRVTFVNGRTTFLVIPARRVTIVPAFASFPQQSDYVPLWKSPATPPPSKIPRTPGQIKKRIPNPLREVCRFLVRPYRDRYPPLRP